MLKNIKTSLTVLTLAFGTFTSAYAQDFLNPDQKEQVLDAMEMVCGDTWCGGDFDFRFKKVSCDESASECSVDFTMSENGDETVSDSAEYSATRGTSRYSVSCTLKQVSSFEDLYKAATHSLSDSAYDRMTDCIGALEDSIQGKQDRN